MRCTAVVCAALLLLSVPGTVLAADEEKDKEGGGDYVTFTEERPTPEPETGKALVYVVRPANIGFAVKSFFLVDDAIAGINKGSSWFFLQVEPGKRLFWSKSENVDALELEVEAGKTYYLKQKVQPGGFRARTKLEVLGEVEGKAALADCKRFATMTAKGRAKGAEIAVEYKDNTKKDLERRAEK